MQNSNSQSNIKESENFRKIVDWRIKNKFLKDQISKLEKLKDFPILSIALFLLKTQLIEFELKQLITTLDLHLAFSNRSRILKMKIKTPKDMDERRMSFGILKEELQKYEAQFLKELQANLNGLVEKRNKFTHRLFNPGSINELIKEADEGLGIANEVMKNIELAEKFLHLHAPFKK